MLYHILSDHTPPLLPGQMIINRADLPSRVQQSTQDCRHAAAYPPLRNRCRHDLTCTDKFFYQESVREIVYPIYAIYSSSFDICC